MTVKTRYSLRRECKAFCSVPSRTLRCLPDTGSSGDSDLSSCTDATSVASDSDYDVSEDMHHKDSKINNSRLHDRCVLTHEKEPSSSLAPTYILSLERISQSKPVDLLQRLSFMWGFDVANGETWRPNPNTDTVPLVARWSRSFKEAEWVLLPHIDVLERILADVRQHAFSPEYKQTRSWPHYTSIRLPACKFHFIPVNPDYGMADPDYTVSQRRWPDECRGRDGKSAGPSYEIFTSPFEGLMIESHIHPYMAITDAMLKLRFHDIGRTPSIYRAVCKKAQYIWDMWTGLDIPSGPTLRRPQKCHAPPHISSSCGDCRLAIPASMPPALSKRKASDEEPSHPRTVPALDIDTLSDFGGDDDDTSERPYHRTPFLNSDPSPSSSVWNLSTTVPTPSKRSRPADEIANSSPRSGLSDAARSVAAWVAKSARPPKRVRRTSPPPLPRRRLLDEPGRAAPAGDWTKWAPEWPAWVAKDKRIARAFAAEGVVRPSRGRGARRRPLGDT